MAEEGRIDLELIRDIVMAKIQDIPNLAREAREFHAVMFPREFVDDLLSIKQEEEDTFLCAHCNIEMRGIEWKKFNSCPQCSQIKKLVQRELDPLGMYYYMLCSCRKANWPLGVTAMWRSIEVFTNARDRLHQIADDIGSFVMEGGELTPPQE